MEHNWAFLMLLFTLPAQAAVQIHYLHNDHLGTPRVVTNQAEQVVWKGQLKPFGETKVEVEAITNHRRFPGQRFDIESRLYYNYFRDYDPTTGRYIQSDPIGLQGGVNTYDYVGGKPIIRIDSFGLDPFLASRPTAGGARHMFIVYGADAQGIGGVIRSFGRRDGGLLGEVDLSTGGFSRGTLQKDQDYWKSKPADLSFVPIPASDAQVECAANSIASQWRYTFPRVNGFSLPTSGHATMNSNTAAQAVANYSAGIPVVAPIGWHPGAENAAIIGFSE